MRLVPRQLLRAGMTGNVPYYGGRFSPAQAYAASHPSAPPQRGMAPPVPAVSGVAPARAAEAATPARPQPDPRGALRHLLDTGVITPEEYDELLARVVE
jgi:hypothetical protein